MVRIEKANMSEVCYQWIDRPIILNGAPNRYNFPAPNGTAYNYVHCVRYLPDRLLPSEGVVITGAVIAVPDYGGTGFAALALDRDREFINQSLYGQSQNGNFGYNSNLAATSFKSESSAKMFGQRQNCSVRYVPGRDALIFVIDASDNANPLQAAVSVWFEEPEDWPAIPDPVTGDNAHTLLLINADGMPNGSTAFQDKSYRNYTVRAIGGCKALSGKVHFDGVNGILAPELYRPGYGTDTDPTHIDWNPQAHDFTLSIKVKPDALPAYSVIASFGSSYGAFVLGQQSGVWQFWASNAGASWNIANMASLGTVTVGVEVEFKVIRDGTTLKVLKNGSVAWSATISGSLFYPVGTGVSKPSGYPCGRLLFGAQAEVGDSGNIVFADGYFKGTMNEIGWSDCAL